MYLAGFFVNTKCAGEPIFGGYYNERLSKEAEQITIRCSAREGGARPS